MELSIVWLLATALSAFISSTEGVCHTWTKEQEDQVCTLVAHNLTFCAASGAGDANCQSIATELGGTDAQCADARVCSFALVGGTAYVTGNATKSGYEILRNCVGNTGIACPNASADLSDVSRMINITGKDGCGVYDTIKLGDHQICDVNVEESLYYCESQALRDSIITTFHPERRIGDLCGGVCMDIRNSTDPKNYKEVIRCVVTGTYLNEETGQRDLCRFHLFNSGGKITAVAYWGIKNMIRNE